MYSPNPMRQMPPQQSTFENVGTSSLAYLRKVYALFGGGIATAIVGGLLALYAGSPTMVADGNGDMVAIPPAIAFAMNHPFMLLIVFIGAFFGARFTRTMPGINVAALFGFTFITGLVVAPSIFIATVMASHGATLDPSPVRDAFILTGAAFTGLTGYVFITKKDFSFLGGMLSTGLWVVLGAMLLGFFFHSATFQLAIASVGVLLFAGYILYDTSRILRDRDERDPVSSALRLFLDVVNLFQFLLQILASGRRN